MAEPGRHLRTDGGEGPLAAAVAPGRPVLGVGWRAELAGFVASVADRIGFCEVVAEAVDPGALPAPVQQLRAAGLPVVPHGVTLSLGGVAEPEPRRVAHLAACADALGAPLVSEHVAFVRADVDGSTVEAGHLLPLPRTREALDVLVRNVRLVQQELPVPLALEPVAALLDLGGELTEAQFLGELVERTGAWLLPDVANAWANAVNHGGDAAALLAALPAERLAYAHVAGGRVVDGLYRDSHRDPVPPAVLELLAGLSAARADAGLGPVPVLLERDGDYPSPAELSAELAAVGVAGRTASGPAIEPAIGTAR